MKPLKPFKPLLAVEADLSTLRFPLYASPKLDGIRTLIRSGNAVSRNLKSIPNDFIRDALESYADVLEGFDGELIVGDVTASDCFNKTSSGVMSFSGTPNFNYYVFDEVCDGSYFDRWIDSDLDQLPSFVMVVAQHLIHNLDELMTIEQHYVSLGYEGIMTRSPDGEYKQGRSTAKEQILLKIKRFTDTEAEIVGFEERMKNGNEATTNILGHSERSSHKANMIPMNTLGAIICKHPDFEETFKIGTGFDDEQRKEIWDNQEKYIYELAKFKYQPAGMMDKPRFPVFLGMRDISDL